MSHLATGPTQSRSYDLFSVHCMDADVGLTQKFVHLEYNLTVFLNRGAVALRYQKSPLTKSPDPTYSSA